MSFSYPLFQFSFLFCSGSGSCFCFAKSGFRYRRLRSIPRRRGCRLPSAYLHSILYLRLPMGTRVPDCWYISSDWAKLIPLSPFTVVDLWAAIPGGTAQYFLLDRHRRPYTSRWCGQIVRLFFVSSSQNIPIVYKVSCYLLFWWRKHRCSYIRSI